MTGVRKPHTYLCKHTLFCIPHATVPFTRNIIDSVLGNKYAYVNKMSPIATINFNSICTFMYRDFQCSQDVNEAAMHVRKGL